MSTNMFAGLYGDLPEEAGKEPQPNPKGALPPKQSMYDAPSATLSAGPTGAAAAISAAPPAPAPKAEAAKKSTWGAKKPMFMPQQRKRQAPSSTARSAAAALAAKKQKLLQERQLQSPDPKAEPEVARKPLTPAAGGLYSYEVTDEYDPRRPHDYDRLVVLRRKQKEIDAKMRVLKAAEERERREREAEARLRGESPPPETGFFIPDRPVEAAPGQGQRVSTAPDRSVVPIAAGRGRGRGATMPAWMTAKEGGTDAGAGRGGGAGGRGRGGVDGHLQSGFGPPPEPEQTVAEKMMANMGYQQGGGLGRDGQGIKTSLQVQKTDRNTGVIMQAEPTAAAVAAGSAAGSQPTRVVLLLNMVGPGEVDGELEGDTREECTKYGSVKSVAIREMTNVPPEEAVRIFVHFDERESAIKAKVDLDGRFFGGRTVVSSYYDERDFGAGKLVPPEVAAREARSRSRFG